MRKSKLFCCMALLVLSMSVLAGCGDKKADKNDTKVEKDDSADKDEKADDQEEVEEPGDVDLGTVDGTTYTNETFGFRCKLADDWTYATTDELLQLGNIVADAANNEQLKETLENTESFYCMYAQKNDLTQNINVVVENLGLMNNLMLSEEGYAEMGTSQMESMAESMGMEDLQMDQKEIDFAGDKHYSTDITFTTQGTSVYERQVYIKASGYMCVITMSAADAADLDTLQSVFEGL